MEQWSRPKLRSAEHLLCVEYGAKHLTFSLLMATLPFMEAENQGSRG